MDTRYLLFFLFARRRPETYTWKTPWSFQVTWIMMLGSTPPPHLNTVFNHRTDATVLFPHLVYMTPYVLGHTSIIYIYKLLQRGNSLNWVNFLICFLSQSAYFHLREPLNCWRKGVDWKYAVIISGLGHLVLECDAWICRTVSIHKKRSQHLWDDLWFSLTGVVHVIFPVQSQTSQSACSNILSVEPRLLAVKKVASS